MRKPLAFILLIIIATLLGGLYGIINDQFSFTISTEYYTKFKFEQFHIAPALPYRLGVIAVGWAATWWMGLIIGIILGIVGLFHKDGKTMLHVTFKAILLNIGVTFILGLTGLAFGKIYLASKPKTYFDGWYIPDNLNDLGNFVSVGSMHNFSYLGGILGLFGGVIYSIRQKKKIS